jgi:hypothetical protein
MIHDLNQIDCRCSLKLPPPEGVIFANGGFMCSLEDVAYKSNCMTDVKTTSFSEFSLNHGR